MLLCLAITSLAYGETSPQKLDSIKVQLKWRHQFQFAGFYAALEKGFYKAKGLDVQLIEARPGMDTEAEILNGNADFGVGTSSILLQRAQGKPVVVLAVIFQHSPSILIALRSSGVQTIHDLIGKTVMIEPNAASNLGYLQREGVLKQIHILRHSFDLGDLISGKVAAQSSFAGIEPYALEKAGIPYRVFSPMEGGVDFYGDNIFTTERQIAEHPERVKAFREATLLGWQYAMHHVDEMLEMIHTKYNPGRSREALAFEAAELHKHMLPDFIEIGYMHPGRWQHIAEVYAELGMTPSGFNQKGFLYDPNPHRDYTWLYKLLVIAATLIASAAILIFFIARTNRKLAAQVAETERMRDKAERANIEKNRFIAAVSHDLRQPTQALAFYADALAHDLKSPDLLPMVNNIRATGASLQTLLDALLDVSCIEAETIHPALCEFAIDELLTSIDRNFTCQARGKGLRLRIMPTGAWVRSDPVQLDRILRNLVSNAIKYTSQGGVLIGCRRDGTALRIEVHDSGIGIPLPLQHMVFREFHQLGNLERDRNKGLGLGLAIANGLARLLGHPLGLRSTQGRGSVFWITVPRGNARPAAAVAALPMPDDLAGKSILLIDDDQMVREAATEIIERFECRIVVAESAAEALDLMRESGFVPDAILTDFRLHAGTTGIAAIHTVIAYCGHTIPAGILTGDTAPERLREARASGFPLAHKPLSGAKLRALLSSLLLANQRGKT